MAFTGCPCNGCNLNLVFVKKEVNKSSNENVDFGCELFAPRQNNDGFYGCDLIVLIYIQHNILHRLQRFNVLINTLMLQLMF